MGSARAQIGGEVPAVEWVGKGLASDAVPFTFSARGQQGRGAGFTVAAPAFCGVVEQSIIRLVAEVGVGYELPCRAVPRAQPAGDLGGVATGEALLAAVGLVLSFVALARAASTRGGGVVARATEAVSLRFCWDANEGDAIVPAGSALHVELGAKDCD